MGGRLAFTVAIGALAAATPARGQSVRLETGADYDSNATREETGGPSDGLMRSVAELRGQMPFAPGGRLSAGWLGGAKLHFEESGEDVLHQRADLGLAQLLGRHVVIRWDAAARDRTSRDPVLPLDHTRFSTGPGVDLRFGPLRVGGRGIYDHTVFKPARSLDAEGRAATGSVGLSFDPWLVEALATLSRRDYEGPPLVANGHIDDVPIVEPAESGHRRDTYTRLALRGQYGGDLLAHAELAWEDNDSNSLGGSVTRTVAQISCTSELFWSVVGTLSATWQHLQYADPQYLSTTELIEDEGRSAVTLRLERPLDDTWSVVGHGGAWFSPGSTGRDYTRTVAGLGVAYGLE